MRHKTCERSDNARCYGRGCVFFNSASRIRVLNPDEDALNKPWCPIPSGIVTVVNARLLRWSLFPLSLSLSIYLEAHWQDISLAIDFMVYNELRLHPHWPMRNSCNAWGYASFQRGGLCNSWCV